MGQVVQLEDIRRKIAPNKAKSENTMPDKPVYRKGVEAAINEVMDALHELKREAKFEGFVEALRRI